MTWRSALSTGAIAAAAALVVTLALLLGGAEALRQYQTLAGALVAVIAALIAWRNVRTQLAANQLLDLQRREHEATVAEEQTARDRRRLAAALLAELWSTCLRLEEYELALQTEVGFPRLGHFEMPPVPNLETPVFSATVAQVGSLGSKPAIDVVWAFAAIRELERPPMIVPDRTEGRLRLGLVGSAVSRISTAIVELAPIVDTEEALMLAAVFERHGRDPLTGARTSSRSEEVPEPHLTGT